MTLNININVDTAITSSIMVFGENIRIPDVFFDEPLQKYSSQHVKKLINFMRNITLFKPRPIKNNTQQLQTDLKSCSHVWVRIDATRLSLQPFYKGPYLVIERNEKYFKLLIDNQIDSVSIDRLKAAKFLPIEYDSVYSQLVEAHKNQSETSSPPNENSNPQLSPNNYDRLERDNTLSTSEIILPEENPSRIMPRRSRVKPVTYAFEYEY